MSDCKNDSQLRENASGEEGNAPSWVGPIPPDVITRSYIFTNLLLASTLSRNSIAFEYCHFSNRQEPVHFGLIVRNDLDPLPCEKDLDVYE